MTILPRFLALVSALVLPLALAAVWADQVVTDTGGYVETVGPLADDQEVQEAAAARLAAATNGLVRQQVGPRAATRVSILTEEVSLRVVDTEAFAVAWRHANHVAHEQFERVVRSDRKGPVVLDVSPVVDEVLDGIRQAGAPVPQVDTSSSLRIRLASSAAVQRVKTTYEVIDTVGLLAAAAWVLLLFSALALGRDRRAVVGFAAAATAVTTALLWFGLWLGDDVAVSSVAATDRPLVRAVYDVLTDDLERWTVVALAASVVVALVNAVLPRSQPGPEQA